MTDEAAASLSPEALAYLETWAASAGQVLGQIAGGTPLAVEVLAAAPPDTPPPAETDLCLLAACSGTLRGEMSLHLPPAIALSLAQLFMGETPEAGAEFKAEYREALEELFRQIAGHVATALKAKWSEVQLRVEAGPPPSWPAAATAWLNTSAGAACQVRAEVRLSAALVAALRPAAEKPLAETAPAAAAPPPAALGPAIDAKLDLVMDVELSATLRFGCRRMLLRDILELTSGAVVELDRQLQEPVDLLLDGRLIARGEVVVVDGNYGLRVSEVISSEPGPG